MTSRSGTTPIRFRQARAIFEAALDKPERERDDYVESACASDDSLLHDVRGMLEADRSSPSAMHGPTMGPELNESSAPEEGRFPAGTVLAGRYRILGLLGKGGMGEVYRAFDIILNQTVALKFLTESRFPDAALTRFRNEVRIARQVSHPNVCRVYDLGMVDGLNFLSMEYVDGEDLAALLRRIGRLPEDKAMEFTRRICAGLAAAHERGVLHRDLKPANIMIDSKGQVRITDFGLACLVEEIPLTDLGSGTPAYMAPEQMAGKDVSVRTDIYSLGMILHEMFTGHARSRESDSSPTDFVKNLDPQIERVILRCLEQDPKRRPDSALRVAMALPGGNAIAAALAAGETPSPEAVAASDDKEGFSIRTALICTAIIVACFVTGAVLSNRFSFLARSPLDLNPTALNFEARALLQDLGYSETPAAIAAGWICCDSEARQHLVAAAPQSRDTMLAEHRPPLIQYVYRQHRSTFPIGPVTYNSPPNSEPGMTQVRFDATGRLLELEVEPWMQNDARDSTGASEIVARLFDAAGLERSRFVSMQPERIPTMMADLRQAWTGPSGNESAQTVRVDIAFWEGRPVLFAIDGFPGAESFSLVDADFTSYAAVGFTIMFAAFLLLLWHRSHGNRLDRHGAFVLFGLVLTLWLVTAIAERQIHAIGIETILFLFAIWLIYLSVEPLVRRHWPDSLIAWTRLTRGRLRDPLVASHILAGIVAASVFGLLGGSVAMFVDPVVQAGPIQYSMTGSIGSLPMYLYWAGQGVFTGLGFLAVVVMMRMAVRNTWIADLLAVGIFNSGNLIALANPGSGDWMTAVIVGSSLLMIALIRQFGFLALLTSWIFLSAVANTPPPVSGWMAGRLVVLFAIPVAVAVWALGVILINRNDKYV